MAATHPLASHKRVTLAALAKHDIISFGTETAHGKMLARLLGERSQPVAPTVDVRYAYVACSIAASGYGVAVVDDLTACRFAHSGVVLRPLSKAVRYQAYALGSTERPLSAGGREMVKLLGQHWAAARGGGPAKQATHY